MNYQRAYSALAQAYTQEKLERGEKERSDEMLFKSVAGGGTARSDPKLIVD